MLLPLSRASRLDGFEGATCIVGSRVHQGERMLWGTAAVRLTACAKSRHGAPPSAGQQPRPFAAGTLACRHNHASACSAITPALQTVFKGFEVKSSVEMPEGMSARRRIQTEATQAKITDLGRVRYQRGGAGAGPPPYQRRPRGDGGLVANSESESRMGGIPSHFKMIEGGGGRNDEGQCDVSGTQG